MPVILVFALIFAIFYIFAWQKQKEEILKRNKKPPYGGLVLLGRVAFNWIMLFVFIKLEFFQFLIIFVPFILFDTLVCAIVAYLWLEAERRLEEKNNNSDLDGQEE